MSPFIFMYYIYSCNVLLCIQGTGQPANKKELKTEANKKRKQSLPEDTDNDESSRDWWTKYFASMEAMIEVNNILKLHN